jgi:hypothetical protein
LARSLCSCGSSCGSSDEHQPDSSARIALWLSGVINDAIRDARDAGLDQRSIHLLLLNYANGEDPSGRARTSAGAQVDSKA